MKTDLRSTSARIRRWRDYDAPALERAVQESAAELRRGMQWLAIYGPDWIERTRSLWRSRQAYNFALLDSTSATLAGSIWLSHINWLHGSANVGYWVRTSLTRRGLATAAVRLVARFGFTQLNLHRLEILVATNNHPSLRIAQIVGAVREGILRERLLLEGRRHDAVMFSLLSGEWRDSDLDEAPPQRP